MKKIVIFSLLATALFVHEVAAYGENEIATKDFTENAASSGIAECRTTSKIKALSNIDSKTEGCENHLLSLPIILHDIIDSESGKFSGQYATARISKPDLKNAGQKGFTEFCDTRISNSGYSWFTIDLCDGTGIQFAGCFTKAGTYGTIDKDGCIMEPFGYITVTGNEYTYLAAND